MKKCLAFVGVVLALAPAVFVPTASAQVSPTRRANASQLRKPVSSNPKLNGIVNALGHTGIVVKIQSAAIAKDGTITARATVADVDGVPLDRLGVSSYGPIALSFIAAYIPSGKTQYVSYTTTVLKATTNSNPSQTQAANDSGGTLVTNAIGDYTYTFKTKAPATFDPTVTHSIGVSAVRNLAEFGTFDEWTLVSNDVFNFVPDGSNVVTTRSITPTAACNKCHDQMFGHGGSRIKVELCIICHTPQTVNPDTKLTQDMPVLIHKIHMGAKLPSVLAGTPYRIWHRGAWSDFSTVVLPQDPRNCTTCHDSAAPQADNWKTNPSRAACGACHDDVDFATGANHAGRPQPDDNQCAGCHGSTQYTDFDASIPGAHLIPENSKTLTGLVPKVISVTGATAGVAPVVKFSLADKSGALVDITKITYLRIILVGPNVDYQYGPNGIRVSENPVATAVKETDGTYTYQMTNKLPATAAGSYTVAIESRNSVTLLPGTMKATTATDSAKPVRFSFSVDKSAVVARRQVVDNAKCASCHMNLGFVHGGSRPDAQECTICHNPTLVDGTSKQSVNLAWQIHSIHRGDNLANPYILGTTNYQEVRNPGDPRNCTACHLPGTYLVENVGAKALVASTGGFTATTPPISAACQGCHDDVETASHALINTSVLGEACKACHKAGEQFSVDRAHQRIF